MLTTQKKKLSTTPTAFFPFRHLVISLLTLLAVATTAAADTYVVSSDSEIPVRSGQGIEYKIISLLQKGDTVTSLEEDGYWLRVRTATGREGWLLKRYLSTQPIDDASSFPTAIGNDTEETSPEAEPDTFQSETGILPEYSEPLQPEETRSLLAEQQLKEANKELVELREKLAAVTLENKKLQEDELIKWFLAGGGVLIIGWLLGLISCKSRRRKPSLL
ncbi:MAG: TIGR04211 family SH3 domain-containing protein [Desulfoarculaceae bacterium]|nr:TIGR04211 family SH3 domain-containing protein [Desulfoarculaceae bacterium]